MTADPYVLKCHQVASMQAALDMNSNPNVAYGLVARAAIVVEAGLIVWLGQAVDLPAQFLDLSVHDLGARLVTPALIDCHTHIVSGGNRAQEFEARLQGASYAVLARAGGGNRQGNPCGF